MQICSNNCRPSSSRCRLLLGQRHIFPVLLHSTGSQLQSSSQSRLISPPISATFRQIHFPANRPAVCASTSPKTLRPESSVKKAQKQEQHICSMCSQNSLPLPAKPSFFPGYQPCPPTLCIFTHNVRYLSFELLASVSSNGSVSPSGPFKLTISENPSECLDPDTGLNHTLGVAWNIPGVCGQAHCELRNQQVYISYAL